MPSAYILCLVCLGAISWAAIRRVRAAGEALAESERRARLTNERLSQLDRERQELLGVAAHDLKNPLGLIIGYAELLLEEPEASRAEVEKAASAIRTAANRMTTLVRNLLDINAIERGELKIHPAPFDPLELARAVVEAQELAARVKGQTISLNGPVWPVSFVADRVVLYQLLENLVSNAVKYSPPGGSIAVRVAVEGDRLRIVVEDDGPGLTREDQAKVFGKFARLSAQPTGGEHSTGLGLSIVKMMVDAMGGRVGCESEPGAGARFFVELTSTPRPAARPPPPPRA